MYICVRGMHGKNLIGRDYIGTEILMTSPQPMRKLGFGKLPNQKLLFYYVCCRSYNGKQTPEICWVTARGYIRVVGLSFVC